MSNWVSNNSFEEHLCQRYLVFDYQLRFNFHSESMTTFSQSWWISGTKPIKNMKNMKSKGKDEKSQKHDTSCHFVNILFTGTAVCYQTVPHTWPWGESSFFLFVKLFLWVKLFFKLVKPFFGELKFFFCQSQTFFRGCLILIIRDNLEI